MRHLIILSCSKLAPGRVNWNLFGQKLHWRPLNSLNKRHESFFYTYYCVRGHLKCDGTRAETRFRLSAKRTNPFKSAGVSVQSTTGSRGVRISGSNAGYTMFRSRVKSTGYPLHSPVSPSLPLPCVTVCHQVSTGVHNTDMGAERNHNSEIACL